MLFTVCGQDLMAWGDSSYKQEDDQETKARQASWCFLNTIDLLTGVLAYLYL